MASSQEYLLIGFIGGVLATAVLYEVGDTNETEIKTKAIYDSNTRKVENHPRNICDDMHDNLGEEFTFRDRAGNEVRGAVKLSEQGVPFVSEGNRTMFCGKAIEAR